MPVSLPGPASPQLGGGNDPFQVSVDRLGNLWMQAGPVIAFHATTEVFQIGSGGRMTATTRPGDEFRTAAGAGSSFQGGNGSNVKAATALPGTLVPDGFFQPAGPDAWRAGSTIDLTFDSGDGSAEISDGTDVVATLPAASATIAPYGTFTATTYGEDEYNGGTPWTVDLEFEGGTPWPAVRVFVSSTDGEIQGGYYQRTGWQEWESAADPDWTITLNGTDEFELHDGTDVVAKRAADATRLFDPSGAWASTTYGATNYGESADATAGTRSAGTFIEQAWALADVTGDIETWVGGDEPSLFIELDTTSGDALLKDGAGTVGERLGGSTATPDGAYVATTYGKDTYHAGAAWTYTLATAAAAAAFTVEVRLDRAVPAAGYLWVELEINPGTGEVLGVSGPFRGAALPANDADLSVVPIAHSDGAGLVTQIQLGPIYWRIPEAGPAGTGLTWISLTSAAYAAITTPDPDTIYDITDYP